MIGHFRRCVTERLLNTKVVVFLGFLWFTVDFYSFVDIHSIRLKKCREMGYIRLKKCNEVELFA